MEKISRILPSSPRFKNADIKSAGAARSGMPSFGRPVGESSLAKKPSFDGMVNAQERLGEFQSERVQTKDPKAEIVDRIANDFFMKRGQGPTVEDNQAIESVLQEFHDADSDLNPVTSNFKSASPDEDAPAVGGYLDIVA